jgi:hypothetical protein
MNTNNDNWDGKAARRISVACIGSRDAPAEAIIRMEELGKHIASKGFIVRTGNAVGADQAFARGANTVDPSKVYLYLPWRSYEKNAIVEKNIVTGYNLENAPHRLERYTKLASENHPAWEYLSPAVRKFMLRNAAIVWNADLVLAHLNHSRQGGGGTGHGWRVAESLNIPRIDLSQELDVEKVKKVINSLIEE